MFKFKYLAFYLIIFVVVLAACSSGASEEITAEEAAPAFQKGGCVACHVIPGVPGAVGTIGPNLSQMGQQADEYLSTNEYQGDAETADDFIREIDYRSRCFHPSRMPKRSLPARLDASNAG